MEGHQVIADSAFLQACSWVVAFSLSTVRGPFATRQFRLALLPAAGVEIRTVNAASITTLDTLFDAFAEAWNFPPRFAQHRNRDSFNDWMRDLDNLTNLYLTKPPASSYLTDMINAHLLLTEQSDIFSWFASKLRTYRDYYRDGVDPAAAFGLLLSAPAGRLDEVRERWLAAGIQVATVTA